MESLPHKNRVLVGLIGANIMNSLSPTLFSEAFAAAGIDGFYHLMDVDHLPGRPLADLLDAARTAGFAGVNITYPFKQEVMALLDVVNPGASEVGAVNTVALAKFYQAAFGMQDVNRIDAPGGPEIFVNFGATIDAAKANKSEPIVIMHRDSDDIKDPIAHVILNVKDMAATVASIKAAGGSMAGDPRPFGNTGVLIGIAIDPAGNRIEMIQRP